MVPNKNLEKGSVVRLRNGGPPMTIEAFVVDDDGLPLIARTVWFDREGQLRRDQFPCRSLVVLDTSQKVIQDFIERYHRHDQP